VTAPIDTGPVVVPTNTNVSVAHNQSFAASSLFIASDPINADSKIFVVHGRDHTARDQLELILHRLGLAPYVLQVTGGGGDKRSNE
jgi:hypothetical protein